MNTRLDGPGIAGVASIRENVVRLMDGASITTYIERFWTVTPDAPTPPKPTPETGEATDWELEDVYDKFTDFHDSLRAVYNLGRTHVENRVCARLPRLWGWWNGRQWLRLQAGSLHDRSQPDTDIPGPWQFCEYDPSTGGPKPQ